MAEDYTGERERKRGHCNCSLSQSFVKEKSGSMGEGKNIDIWLPLATVEYKVSMSMAGHQYIKPT